MSDKEDVAQTGLSVIGLSIISSFSCPACLLRNVMITCPSAYNSAEGDGPLCTCMPVLVKATRAAHGEGAGKAAASPFPRR
jgi:hypothetical protein